MPVVHFTKCPRLRYDDPTLLPRGLLGQLIVRIQLLRWVPYNKYVALLSCTVIDVPNPKAGMQLRLPSPLTVSRLQKQTLTVRNSQQKLPRQYLKPLLLLTFEDPTTWQVYNSVGENTANAAKLLCLNVAEGSRECGCAEVRLSKGDADDVVSQDLPNCC